MSVGPESAAESSAASAQLAALGPFFAAESHDPNAAPTGPWRSMAELFDDPDAMSQRVYSVRAYLSAAGGRDRPPEAVEPRVAASVTHLGLAARTLSPFYALAVTRRRLPSTVGLRDLRWQPASGSTFALSIPGLDRAAPIHDDETSETMARDVESLAIELCDAMRPFGVSPRVLWGNVASALNGARIALSAADPGLAARARADDDDVKALLSRPLLADAWRRTAAGAFQRRSCCLIYRAAPDRRGALCGDCVLSGRNAG